MMDNVRTRWLADLLGPQNVAESFSMGWMCYFRSVPSQHGQTPLRVLTAGKVDFRKGTPYVLQVRNGILGAHAIPRAQEFSIADYSERLLRALSIEPV